MLDNLNDICLMIASKWGSKLRIVYLNKKPQRINEYTYYLYHTFNSGIIIISEKMYNYLYSHRESLFEVIKISTLKKLMLEERGNKLSKI